MPTLKDYLGSLVRDINYARAIADAETATIAKMYAEHDILKHFSVPRMKIQDTELTIPVAIDAVELTAEADYQPVDNTAFYTKTYSEIKNVYKVDSFSRDLSTALRKAIYEEIDTLEKRIKSGTKITDALRIYADAVTELSIQSIRSDKTTLTAVRESIKRNALNEEDIATNLAAHLHTYLIGEIRPHEFTGKIENALVTVESDKLREKKPESLLYIKLKITEESMEWQTMEDADGNIVSRLMVE